VHVANSIAAAQAAALAAAVSTGGLGEHLVLLRAFSNIDWHPLSHVLETAKRMTPSLQRTACSHAWLVIVIAICVGLWPE
jgi:hypothetical protein